MSEGVLCVVSCESPCVRLFVCNVCEGASVS